MSTNGRRPFTPRSFVGMSESCKKRLARRSDVVRFAITNPAACAFTAEQARALGFRIGGRLRPCPGCSRCGVLRFQKVGGFVGDCCDYLLWTGSRTLMVMKAGMHKKRVRATLPSSYPLPKMQAYVADGSWQLLRRDDEDCNGSGVLPARPRSARC